MSLLLFVATLTACTPTDTKKRDLAEAQARFTQGVQLAQRGEIEGAMEIFREIIEEYPELPGAYNNLATLHAARGEMDEAREVLLRSLEVEPRQTGAHESLGDLYTSLAQEQYALAYEADRRNRRTLSKAEWLAWLLRKDLGRQQELPPPGSALRDPGAAGEPAQAAPVALDAPVPPLAGTKSLAEVSLACFRVGPFRYEKDAGLVAQWLRNQDVEADTLPGVSSEPKYYSVYLPPKPTLEEAKAVVARARGEGVEDLLLVTSGPRRNTVLLGAYKTRAAAERRANELGRRGFQAEIEAQGEQRTVGDFWIQVTEVSGQSAWRDALSNAFPQYAVAASACR